MPLNEAAREWFRRQLAGMMPGSAPSKQTIADALRNAIVLLGQIRGDNEFVVNGMILMPDDARKNGLEEDVLGLVGAWRSEASREGVDAPSILELEISTGVLVDEPPQLRRDPAIDRALDELRTSTRGDVRIATPPPSRTAARALQLLRNTQTFALEGWGPETRIGLDPMLEGFYAAANGLFVWCGEPGEPPPGAEPLITRAELVRDLSAKGEAPRSRVGTWGRASVQIAHRDGVMSIVPWDEGDAPAESPSLAAFLRSLADHGGLLPLRQGTRSRAIWVRT